MTDCCDNAASEIEKLQARQSKTLKVVLGINVGMFLVEFVAGLMAASTALLADSLDMLGDAVAYGISLLVVSRHDGWKAVSALIKAGIMALFGLFVLGQAAFKLLHPMTPHFETIGLIGVLALTANAACLWLLWRHRAEDVNMRSVWLCSRNDIIANASVLVAALGVWLSSSQWPDLLVGLGIAALFLRSAFHVFKDASATFVTHNNATHQDSGTLDVPPQ
jgi:cation diffusion facilitator family transporter